jgi:hypothetical protein
MTLAEALMERQDICKNIDRVKEEIQVGLFVKSSEENEVKQTNKQSLEDLIDNYLYLTNKLKELNLKIDKANEGIKDKMYQLRNLDSLITFFKMLRTQILDNTNSSRRRSYFDDTIIELDPVLSYYEINTELIELEEERRELDKEIQKYNWNTEV